MSNIRLKYILFFILIIILCKSNHINALLDDDIIYDFEWPGKPNNPGFFPTQDNVVNFYTNDNENYKCVVPEIDANKDVSE